MKKKTKPTSVRLDNELLEKLDQKCSKIGCSRNDYIKNSVEFIIYGSSDFDFGNEKESKSNPEEKEEPKPIITEIVETKPIVKEVTTREPSVMAHGKIYDNYGNLIGNF